MITVHFGGNGINLDFVAYMGAIFPAPITITPPPIAPLLYWYTDVTVARSLNSWLSFLKAKRKGIIHKGNN